MESCDTLFPSYNKPVGLFSMPVAAYIDVDNNGVNDLIVSAFDPGNYTSRNLRALALFEYRRKQPSPFRIR
ncbi:MAG: hypothetical protein R2764_00385 [Bacteroidales bacterium]